MPKFRFSDENDAPYGEGVEQRPGCWGFLTCFVNDVNGSRDYYHRIGKPIIGDSYGFPLASTKFPTYMQILENYNTGTERLVDIYNTFILKAPQWFEGIELIGDTYLRLPVSMPFGMAYNSLRLIRNMQCINQEMWDKLISYPLTTPQLLYAVDMYYGANMNMAYDTDACITPRLAMENMNAIIKRFEDGVDLIEDNNTPLISDTTGVSDLFKRYGRYAISQFLEPKMRENGFSVSYYGGGGKTRDGSNLPSTLDDFIKEVNA